MKHQHRHPKRIAFLKLLLQAMPEHSRQLSVMLALSFDMPLWQRISSFTKPMLCMQVWDVTPTEDRFRFFPLVVKHQRRHPERIAFLKLLLQAMPERSRQLGVMLALSLDMPLWQRISEELPDLIPRGMAGFQRYT
jgi:hypothetical protein